MDRLKQSNMWCCVPGCKSDGRKRGKFGFMSYVEFFPFPGKVTQPKLRKRWLDQVLREDYEPQRWHRVCSLHFVDGRPTAANPIPTLFPRNNYGKPIKERDTSSIDKRQSESVQTSSMAGDKPLDRELLQEVDMQTIIPVVNYETAISTPKQLLESCVPENECNNKILNDHSYSYSSKIDVESVDASCQTDLTMTHLTDMEDAKTKLDNKDELLRNLFVEKITLSDRTVKDYTGIPSKTLLHGLFGVLQEAAPKVKYWTGQSTKENVNYQQNTGKKKTGPERKLPPFHEFIITLVRLRLAFTVFCLSDIFGVSQARVSQIFTTWINLMYLIFVPLLKWPSSAKVKKNLPRSFKLSFPKTTCIIDCTEFEIEKPRSPTAQSQTYSSYKHRNTYKALVSITPNGAFNFVSDLWGGNTSDRYITKESGFLENIKSGDEVMADRGFLIRDLLLERRATLNIPPFTKNCKWGKGKRLNVSDVRKTRSIARLRIHVERAIERLKRFRILVDTMQLPMKCVANQILKVCGFFCNLYKPLVKK